MKERPIIFSTPMVRALLEGRKTQTRRVCKNKVYANGFGFNGHDFNCHNDYLPPSALLMDYRAGGYDLTTSDLEGWGEACPYGQPGDRLWVRETFCHLPEFEGLPAETYYKADAGDDDDRRLPPSLSEYRWKPSIHMPRNLSRILLEVVSVRVERLLDIRAADCIAEGCSGGHGSIPGYHYSSTPQEHFYWLWDSINGENAYRANPWVWVVEFRRITP